MTTRQDDHEDRFPDFDEPVGPGGEGRPAGPGDAAAAGDLDRVAAFQPAIIAIRWGTTAASLALCYQARATVGSAVVPWAVALVLYTTFRTLRPIRYTDTPASLFSVLGEVLVLVVAVCTTGYWESPLVFSLLTGIAVAGFARGFGFAIEVGVAAALAVTVASLLDRMDDATVQLSIKFSLVLLLVAVIAGWARRISGEADRQHSLALDRLGRLADANALLFSLHRVTQTLPASLDLDDVLDTTIGRLRGLFRFDFAAVLVYEEAEHSWELVRREGARLPMRLATEDLPAPLRTAMNEQSVLARDELTPAAGGPGLAPKASTGMYAALGARGALIGLLAVERQDGEPFTARDLELLRGFVEPVALAIDNARWFGRLRTVGADEERTRIARDLHDRIGQSLAYLAFELDRIVGAAQREEEVLTSLERLRDDVRGVIREVRDTLYDLRTDVSESQDMATTLEAFAARVAERAELDFELHCDRGARLPILQEREMWRIAQEAITNVERHARARHVRVVWRCNGTSATLDITDDGQGFPIGRAGRLDSYGILGMRERAASIGATLELTSEPEKGTRIRCTLLRDAADDAVGEATPA